MADGSVKTNANASDPLNYFLQARVPLAFLLDCGKRSLGHMLDNPQQEYRIASRKDDGGFNVSAYFDAISFLEGALAAGLQPWGADDGDPSELTFYNAVPCHLGGVLWFSMDGCCNLQDDSWVPLCLPPQELKRALCNEKRRKVRRQKKFEVETNARKEAARAAFSASLRTVLRDAGAQPQAFN